MQVERPENYTLPLLAWYADHGRHDLPWRKTRDPYRILVSELMLQQTQVPRVVPKYLAFIERFPTIDRLARAERADVLRMWQGLGYNSRAVRLHALARMISSSGGMLPLDEKELLALPGIGPYTAGAIMIFAHDEPARSVDVNVRRVITRLTTQKGDAPAGIDDCARRLLLDRAHDVQSALMDLGSAVCTARDPACGSCPLQHLCRSRGVHPSEQRARRQSAPFRESTRWYRGAILKALLDRPRDTRALLRHLQEMRPTPVDTERFTAALDALRSEGVVSLEKGCLSVR